MSGDNKGKGRPDAQLGETANPQPQPQAQPQQSVANPPPLNNPVGGPTNNRRPVQEEEEVADSPDEEVLDTEDDWNERFKRMIDVMRKRVNVVQVTNPNFEVGRPIPKPTGGYVGDPTNVYNRPSLESLMAIKQKSVSNNMANSEDVARIYAELEGLGVPTEHVQGVLIQLAIYCKDASSSGYMEPVGVFRCGHQAVEAAQVAAIVAKEAGTLRRVCRLFAPVTWQYMIANNAPPSDWAEMGYQKEERFAAFDCFEYVENPAAIQPRDGILRRPTKAEYVAHKAHKRIALDRAGREETYANLETEITGGRRGPMITRNFNNANNH